MQQPTLTDRLVSLWDHLGLRDAHVATQMPADIDGMLRRHPERIAGLALCEATSIDATALAGLASRVTLIAGDAGQSGKVAEAALPQLPGARRVVLPGYGAPIWGDCVSAHPERIVAALGDLPGEPDPPRATADAGSHAGITYRIQGTGPALVLLPLFLTPAQWEAAIPRLAERFSVILLGGRHLSGVALLEDRGASPSYVAMVGMMFDVMAPAAGERVLEVGCGSGAVTRLAARRLPGPAPITAVDINPFLLREAAALAEAEGVADRIRFGDGNADGLPFDDAAFDHAYAVTVLEECDAELGLRELRRVVRPGGRVGVVVRATELPHAWNLDLPEPLRAKVDSRPPLVGPRGVADRSLYRRMAEAGFTHLTCAPMVTTLDKPDGPFFRYAEGNTLARLTAEETSLFMAARQAAQAAGVLFTTYPHHCAIGRRPDA